VLLWTSQVSRLVCRTSTSAELPLALSPTLCFYRKRAIEALNATGRPWRVAYTSPSLAGAHAAVRVGPSVTVLPHGIRMLGQAEAVPSLADTETALCRASKAVGRLAEHIVRSLEGTQGHLAGGRLACRGAEKNSMRIDLSGKQAVVSGSTAGIGYAIAKGLAGTGANVVINGRDERKVMDAAKRLAAEVPGAPITGVAADLGTAAGVYQFASQVPEADILVNNLGIFEPKPFLEIEDDEWERFFQVNVMSGVRLSRRYLPGMLARGWGRIVFISSESGVQIPVEMVHYGATKTAQLAVSRGLAETAAGSGVTVNAVLPGPTRSEGVVDFFGKLAEEQGKSVQALEAEFIQQNRPSSLIRRLAGVDEVASMVVYVCSEQASATTGAALRVDGGVVRSVV
jgi:NAD(P)-dependent dehydrogenase (short-subunit alcohol dehydrogenase family)